MIRHHAMAHLNTKRTPKNPKTIHVSNGFTIVELIVIIVVIGILAAITVVSYTAVTENAKKQTTQTDAQTIATALNKYKADHGGYPSEATFQSSDFAASNKGVQSTFQYSYDATTGKYCLTASVEGASAYIKSGSLEAKEGGCPGHGVNGIAAVTNYAPNPSYEATSGWYSNNGASYPVSADTSVKRSGSRSLKGSNLSASPTLLSAYAVGGTSGNGYTLPAAGTYTQSVYFRAGVAHTGRMSIAWRVNGTWSTAQSSATVTGSVNGWTRVTQTFTIPENTEYVRSGVFVVATASQPAGTPGWIDDYMVTKGSDASGYGDGTTTNWLWVGQPNASASYGPAQK